MIGQTLGHYRIQEKLGSGGMGEVYLGHDERLERDVAIKVLPAGALADEGARRRFRNEALALAKLSHPNIEAVYDFDTQDGTDFLVMEYVPGPTLSEKLAAEALPEKEIVRLGAQLAEGLAAAHGQGIVHRDLKPANLRLTPDGRLKILDFGLARLLRPEAEQQATASITAAHAVVGTLPYMAPEQLRGEAVDARTDLYAAGVVLFEMATGRQPFQEKVTTALMHAILHQPCPSPRRFRGALSSRLEQIIEKCLDKNPERRFQSARELRVDLERLATPSASEMILPGRTQARPPRRGSGRQIKSLVVLPLSNLSREPEQDYFAEGMTEALITDLAKIGALKVVSRTSAMRYKGTEKTVPEIAEELNVDGVVEGSVLRAGERVRITAQLIHAATDTHLWAESYERDLRDVLALQSEVARAIAAQIHVKLKPHERARLASARRVDPAAHEALLKARFHWSRWDPAGFQKAIEYFGQAIALDPTYAPAHAGLADSYAFLGYWGFLPPQEAYPRANAAARKALELDDWVAEAHRALAWVHWFYDWELLLCEKELRRALALRPGDPVAHAAVGVFEAVIYEDHERAWAQVKRAQELDPLSVYVGTMAGWILFWARRYPEGIEQARRVLELDPACLQAQVILGCCLTRASRHDEAILTVERAVQVWGIPLVKTFLAAAYAAAGRKEDALPILKELAEGGGPGPSSLALLGSVFAVLGEWDRAFECLEKAYRERDAMLFWVKVTPLLDPIRTDARYLDLLRRMNFPSKQPAARSS